MSKLEEIGATGRAPRADSVFKWGEMWWLPYKLGELNPSVTIDLTAIQKGASHGSP